MTRNEMISKLEILESQKYKDSPNNPIRKAIEALYANNRFLAASHLEMEGEALAEQVASIGNLKSSNF